MKEKIHFDYYYGQEADQFSFFRIPRVLVKDERFSSLSSDAKLLYGLMLDRMSLSMANGWVDGANRVYIIYTIKDIQEDLSCGKDKAVKTLAELDSVKGIGLVEKKRIGLGKPDIIYVKNFIIKEKGGKEQDGGKADFKNAEKPNSRSRKNRIQEVGKTEFKDADKPNSAGLKNRIQDFGKSEFRNADNKTSGGRKDRIVEVGLSEPNYTDNSYTEDCHIESIYPSERGGTPALPGSISDQMDGMRICPVDPEAVLALIRENIEYDHHMRFDTGSDRKMYDELYRVMADTVLGETDSIIISGRTFPYEIVRSRMLKLTGEHLEYVREKLSRHTGEIRNIRSYMLAALYNAPATMETYYTQTVQHDMYGGGWQEMGIV